MKILISFILSGATGFFCGVVFGIKSWEFWVLLGLYFSFALIQRMIGYEDGIKFSNMRESE